MSSFAVLKTNAVALTKSAAKLKETHTKVTIVDIRRKKLAYSIRDDILEKLQPADGKEKKLPTILLYDEMGLKLFEAITFLDEYYLTNAEIEVLEIWAMEMAKRIKPESMIIELGSGNLRKTKLLLDALEKIGQPFEYFALDLSFSELERSLTAIPTYRNISKAGLHGTYDDGLQWLKRAETRSKPKCIMSLGSSLGNFTRDEAGDFLKSFVDVLHPERDLLLIGLDGCQEPERVFKAYNDRHGITRQFILNGLAHVNQILGDNVFKAGDWEYVGEYDQEAGRHQAFYSPNKDVIYENIFIKSAEKIRVEESYKYSPQQRSVLWARATLVECAIWGTKFGDIPYRKHFLP